MRGPVTSVVQRYAGRLRYPRLLLLTAALFGADLVFPDVIPFVDEILLGLCTVLLATFRKRRSSADGTEGREPGGGEPRP
jgi:hypothetical protein